MATSHQQPSDIGTQSFVVRNSCLDVLIETVARYLEVVGVRRSDGLEVALWTVLGCPLGVVGAFGIRSTRSS